MMNRRKASAAARPFGSPAMRAIPSTNSATSGESWLGWQSSACFFSSSVPEISTQAFGWAAAPSHTCRTFHGS